MNARYKLNVIFLFAGVRLAFFVGMLSQSWLVFFGVLAEGAIIAT